jgi:MazG family protein
MTDKTHTKLEERPGALEWLVALMQRLLGPGGCPWDQQQSLDSLRPYLVEETYELLDALEEGDIDHHAEELGDLLFQIVFQAALAKISMERIIQGIGEKLIRRHPHVFGGERATGVDDVLRRWTAIKVEEKKDGGPEAGGRPSRLGRIPRSLPGLLAAVKVGERAGAVGFDWPDAPSVLAKVEEELGELKRALADAGGRAPAGPASPEVRHEIGDLLFAVASLARKAGVDPEDALRSALGRFERRFRHIEERIDVSRATLDEMEALWQAAKEEER